MTTKITNKQDPRNVLYGEVTHDYRPDQDYFEFKIKGNRSGNGFVPSEWDFEELVELPTKHLAVISMTPGTDDSGYARYFFRGSEDQWIEDDGDVYSDEDIREWLDEGEKLTVIFEGIDNG